MNKTKKRQLNLKNKLLAAIAMLLVSSIMMVSSTYAWFTLSTAPEVQGITTTVGANGNLEIALSPESGDYNRITSGVGDSIMEGGWVAKNQTWGNLLDLSDSAYRLNELTLLPSRLNIAAGEGGASATLGLNPLKIPVYGADGRISELKADGVGLGAYEVKGDAAGFMAGNNKYGIRAVGTSSSMSPDQIAFNSALSGMDSNTTVASTIVGNALTSYGSALATMAVNHALKEGAADTDDYSAYVADLKALSAELVKASDSVETALYNALMAVAKTSVGINVQVGEQSAYAFIKSSMEDKVPLENVWNAAGIDFSLIAQAAPLVNAYNKWVDTDAAVAANAAKVNALDASQKVEWAAISDAMSGLMNTNNITVNGFALGDVKANLGAIIEAGGVQLELGAGSGVLANFGELSGNIVASVRLSGDTEYNGIPLNVVPVNIATTTQPAAGPLLKQARALIATVGAAQGGEETANIIDVVYGYAIDFVFRTNAANSSLLLQTEGVDRIYDGTEGATMGNGSSMTFSDKTNNLESLVSMMSGIRVVFTNTKGDTSKVYGIAKVNFDNTEFELDVTAVERTINETTAEVNGAQVTTATEVFTEGATTGKTWKLSVVAAAGAEKMVLTSDELAAHQYIVWEIVKDEATGENYAEATIKTALWTTIDTVVTTTPAGDEAVPVETNGTADVEITVNGTPIFFEELETVNAQNTKVVETAAAQVERLLTAAKVTGLVYNDTYTDEAGASVVVEGTMTLDEAITTIAANHRAPVYQRVKDQDVTLEGPLSLYNYTLTDGKLVFGAPMDVQALTTLDQNVATGITAMVYLDGDYVDNGDVSNSVDGISNTGSLNLQFASSANLVPMANTTLQNSIAVKFPSVEGLTFTGETVVDKDTAYTGQVVSAAEKAYTVYAVGQLNGQEIKQALGVVAAGGTLDITVPAEYMKANIEIVVEEVAAP